MALIVAALMLLMVWLLTNPVTVNEIGVIVVAPL